MRSMSSWKIPASLKAVTVLAIINGFLLLSGCSALPWKYDLFEVDFGQGPEPLQGELYLPQATSAPMPAVVVVHGGSWVRRTGDMAAISRKLAAQGIAAFNITYRSAIDYPYPAAVEDVRQGITWLRLNASRYNIDPGRIGGWGFSAGGHLILRAGLDPQAGLKAIVSGGTPALFSYWPESPIITRFIGASYSEAPAQWEDASPVNHVHPDSPPVFLYHGADDELVAPIQMEFMAQALSAQKVPHQSHLVPGRGHLGTYLFNDASESLAIEFLQHWL